MRHEFVEYAPERLEDGVLYVSIQHACAMHRCACGCGAEVTTPLSPTGWELRFDGEAVSLYPSIGNWELPCRSHYWIWRGRVVWARSWSAAEIARNRANEGRLRDRYEGRLRGRYFDGPDDVEGPGIDRHGRAPSNVVDRASDTSAGDDPSGLDE